MRYILFLVFSRLSFLMSSQQQQQMGNVYLASNMNPAVQISQTNVLPNVSDSNDGTIGNEMSQQGNSNEYNNEIQSQSMSNAKQVSSSNKGKDFNFSLNVSSRSSSSSGSSSASRSNKHTFIKKLKKFERNFYGKFGNHKKSKHLVDVCFHWS